MESILDLLLAKAFRIPNRVNSLPFNRFLENDLKTAITFLGQAGTSSTASSIEMSWY